jgi:hypothetical protein
LRNSGEEDGKMKTVGYCDLEEVAAGVCSELVDVNGRADDVLSSIL